MKTLILGAGISLAASFSFNAAAADGAALYTAKNCYLVAQMKDIKSGARNNGMSMAMKAMVATVTDEEFEAIADYLSKVK